MSKILVAYFSASGVTKKLAKKVAQASNADIYEIEPEIPYTEDDLDWHNPKSRSSIEMNETREFRPAISANKKIENIKQYDVLIIGFPIWWYVAPTIINTFLESYDLTGKKIVLFATSGMSGMGKTIEKLKLSAVGAEFIAEKRFSGNASQDDVNKWIRNLKL